VQRREQSEKVRERTKQKGEKRRGKGPVPQQHLSLGDSMIKQGMNPSEATPGKNQKRPQKKEWKRKQ
jgi:hypothetical protein